VIALTENRDLARLDVDPLLGSGHDREPAPLADHASRVTILSQ